MGTQREDTIAILRGQRSATRCITASISATARSLWRPTSQRYITDRQLPDKAIDLIDEAGSRIRMEIDSKPEAMDRLERRLIQLKIEREAVKKEDSAAAEKELNQLDEQIELIEREYADLEEVWLAEKAAVQGVTQIKSEIEQAKLDLEVARRAGDLAGCGIQHGLLPDLERRLQRSARSAGTALSAPA